MKLAWAMSIHKSQGQTLERAKVRSPLLAIDPLLEWWKLTGLFATRLFFSSRWISPILGKSVSWIADHLSISLYDSKLVTDCFPSRSSTVVPSFRTNVSPPFVSSRRSKVATGHSDRSPSRFVPLFSCSATSPSLVLRPSKRWRSLHSTGDGELVLRFTNIQSRKSFR